MMSGSTPRDQELTLLLGRVANGDQQAANELLPLVYEQLRAMARVRMSYERAGHTLQATALVHEAYARMLAPGDGAFENRRHFFFAAAEAMRRILIDHARSRNAEKRGGGDRQRVRLDISAIADLAVVGIRILDDLCRVEVDVVAGGRVVHPQQARCVAGYTADTRRLWMTAFSASPE